ncbi:hypothetical protein D3C78_1342260 [compost metagenome]
MPLQLRYSRAARLIIQAPGIRHGDPFGLPQQMQETLSEIPRIELLDDAPPGCPSHVSKSLAIADQLLQRICVGSDQVVRHGGDQMATLRTHQFRLAADICRDHCQAACHGLIQDQGDAFRFRGQEKQVCRLERLSEAFIIQPAEHMHPFGQSFASQRGP